MRAQHLPFFALSSRFFKNLYSTFYKATMVFDNALTKALISIQHYTFLPMMLVARFGKPFHWLQMDSIVRQAAAQVVLQGHVLCCIKRHAAISAVDFTLLMLTCGQYTHRAALLQGQKSLYCSQESRSAVRGS